MANLAEMLKDLREERGSTEKHLRGLDKAIAVLGTLVGRNHREPGQRSAGKRTLSASARRRIAAAQKARWAKWKREQRKKAA
jgi:hypothetical protein